MYAECIETTATKLKRIATLSAADPNMVFTNVIHHINEESLRACYHELNGKKAIGIDGVDKAAYGEHLEENLQELMSRVRRMAYIPGNIRQVLIPKEGKSGATRPLGISNLEDKLIQRAMHKVLESIYEPLFSNDSYGFRPKRGCHDAIKALYDHLIKHEVEAVIDVDISNYFGSIPQDLVMEIIGKKISDPRILRYLIRMFKAGMLVDGELQRSDEGLVQGSACSPIIANIFAHEVIDTWIETTVKPHCKGEVKMVRYADDIVICCRYEQDAERIQKALGQRLSKYGLKMNEEKTKLVGFSRRKQRSGTQQESFNFLGFTFYIGESRNGFSIVKMKTEGRRFSSKLKKVNDWARTCRNKMPQAKLMKLACSKLMGHIQYYGISHNYRQVDNFVYKVTVILFKWLNRRSQRKSFSWDKFRAYLELMNFPKAKICHRLF